MTKIEITKADPRYSIQFDGHATGSAEVCAGISALMYSLEGYLRNHEQDLFLHSAKIDDPGWGYISFELEDPSNFIRGAFDLVVIGLMQIAASYPDFCEVKLNEIKK